ncbi:TPA: hypothetical protein ACG2L8_000636 [Legionella pneumophila]|nr:hypothetical protein [Legionella pneumophila]HAT2065483.1 hypothetical protein [Legionella pneumophila]HAT8591976.1 hypothetical protein [Legionella pneumophila]HAU1575714.1 hypothetical protein [Legionella pneumophila]HAU1679721.1 hypothetical protein [Legionella pneumophila]HAU3699400.1 hypothetical protein [Legionella pneumophila]
MKNTNPNTPDTTSKPSHYEGPVNPGEKGFVILYDKRSLVKPFFEKITPEQAKQTSPAQIDVIYPANPGC